MSAISCLSMHTEYHVSYHNDSYNYIYIYIYIIILIYIYIIIYIYIYQSKLTMRFVQYLHVSLQTLSERIKKLSTSVRDLSSLDKPALGFEGSFQRF